jgi:F420-0:gamma-glutamyl ligase
VTDIDWDPEPDLFRRRAARCVPADDADLRRLAETALAMSDGLPAEAVASLLQGAVGERFPAAVVVQMESIAATADEEVWYVFRDGRRRAGEREEGRA